MTDDTNTPPEKLKMHSPDLTQVNIEKIKKLHNIRRFSIKK